MVQEFRSYTMNLRMFRLDGTSFPFTPIQLLNLDIATEGLSF